jgi:hypothetical protein
MNGLLKTAAHSVKNVAKNSVQQRLSEPVFVTISGLQKPFFAGKSAGISKLIHRINLKISFLISREP